MNVTTRKILALAGVATTVACMGLTSPAVGAPATGATTASSKPKATTSKKATSKTSKKAPAKKAPSKSTHHHAKPTTGAHRADNMPPNWTSSTRQ